MLKIIQQHAKRADMIRGIRLNGVDYVTKTQAMKMAEVSRPTFDKKVAKYGIKTHRQENGRVYFERREFLEAIYNGWFERWI